jgi:hypothetical protein
VVFKTVILKSTLSTERGTLENDQSYRTVLSPFTKGLRDYFLTSKKYFSDIPLLGFSMFPFFDTFTFSILSFAFLFCSARSQQSSFQLSNHSAHHLKLDTDSSSQTMAVDGTTLAPMEVKIRKMLVPEVCGFFLFCLLFFFIFPPPINKVNDKQNKPANPDGH